MDMNKAKKNIHKRHGKESLMNLSDEAITNKVLCPFKFKGIEHVLGIKGLPVNRTVELFGQPSSGKTTLALHMAEAVQTAGGDVAFIDVEHAIDVDYAAKLGVDVDSLLISQPDHGNQAIDIMMDLLKEQKLSPERPLLIILDSVDALIPQSELEDDYDSAKSSVLGERARLMSRSMRNLTALVKNVNCLVLFINQVREKINKGGFGPSKTTSGGNALKFYASVRLEVINIGQYKVADKVVGNNTRVKVVKSKISPPFKEYDGLIIHGKGFQEDWDILEKLKASKLIKKAGSWTEIDGIDKKFQGYSGFQSLLEDGDYRQTILAMVE